MLGGAGVLVFVTNTPFLSGCCMELKLYRTNDGVRTMNKVLTDERIETIRLKQGVDIVSPTLLLSGDVDYSYYNYAAIPILNRLYYIQNVEIVVNGLYRLMLETDYLETYRSQILSSTFRYRRGIRSGDFIDTEIERLITSVSSEYSSGVGFSETETSMVLTTVGVSL